MAASFKPFSQYNEERQATRFESKRPGDMPGLLLSNRLAVNGIALPQMPMLW
jgi:hypothetical protein